jgi:hypothetical protein
MVGFTAFGAMFGVALLRSAILLRKVREHEE